MLNLAYATWLLVRTQKKIAKNLKIEIVIVDQNLRFKKNAEVDL